MHSMSLHRTQRQLLVVISSRPRIVLLSVVCCTTTGSITSTVQRIRVETLLLAAGRTE